ncbi:unnamed protein product [Sphenostylis stenocarpa]|uniref:Beta-amylase n=1 Tax=Sphenostylis stenocarpa TaxID=92480 RepID=A0AA86VQD3_9FABA|nr:unnamed protein product [Sphenostylis stenocarpa]
MGGCALETWESGALLASMPRIPAVISMTTCKRHENMAAPLFMFGRIETLSVLVGLLARAAGIRWWFKTESHAAELTSGYYNLYNRDGYRPIARMLSRHNAILNFTCLEMSNKLRPKVELRNLSNRAGWMKNLEVAGENALARYDPVAYNQMLLNARPSNRDHPRSKLYGLTYLRLSKELMQQKYFDIFKAFVRKMHAILGQCPDPERYCYFIGSEPKIPLEVLLEATEPLEPYPWCKETDSSKSEVIAFLDYIIAIILRIYSD